MKRRSPHTKATAHTISKDLFELLNDYSSQENSFRSMVVQRALKEYFWREGLLNEYGKPEQKPPKMS
ncbi:MAG: hypothetical protein BRC36_16555 [Cyanobacteria bacterium QH_2_48_84]|nr:MAG: hypothetical protein BRC36_16555 [Cyanobacteria bacterium QH_2_48_84]